MGDDVVVVVEPQLKTSRKEEMVIEKKRRVQNPFGYDNDNDNHSKKLLFR